MRRRELRRLLNATVGSRAPGEINYYQGLHDIAAVLLFVAGERPAAQMLGRMAVCHLRDCTRYFRKAAYHCVPSPGCAHACFLHAAISTRGPVPGYLQLHAHGTPCVPSWPL